MELSPQDRLLYYAFTVMVVVLVVLTGYAAAIVALWPWGLLAVAAHIAILVLLAQKRR